MDKKLHINEDTPDRENLRQYKILLSEATTVREKDKVLVKSLFQNFYNKMLRVGIGYTSAYGSILAGDYFDLIKLPDNNYLFIFADISGHGLPAYTTLIRLRSAVTISIREIARIFKRAEIVDSHFLIKRIIDNFTDIMDAANSPDFACVNFTFIYNKDDKYVLKFYNRGMLFPIITRKFQNNIIDVYNLNNSEKGWLPRKGLMLGSDVKKVSGDLYAELPSCEFIIYEGDSILFFSDGIIEAYRDDDPDDQFGEDRMIRIFTDHTGLEPQVAVQEILDSVYDFIGNVKQQKDDMTAILIDFPEVRN